jgi:hypothetical protein
MTSNLVYALDPTKSGALTVSSGASVQVMGGVVDESDSSSAFECYSGTTFTAPYIGVVGGTGSGRHYFHFGSCSYPQASPVADIAMPEYGSPPNPDPLYSQRSALAAGAPSAGDCTGSTSQMTVQGTYTLYPGTYCGGIVIENGGYGGGHNTTNVTFEPGIYTLISTSSSNGGLSIDAGASVTGTGVGFYNYGPYGGINMTCQVWCGGGHGGGGHGGGYYQTGTIALTAPDGTNCPSCSTAWQGILFYQDPGNQITSTVVGSNSYNVSITGTSYFPNASVNYAMDVNSVTYNLLVAKDITMGVQWGGHWIWAWFFHNFWWLRNHRSPLHGTGGVGVVE